MNIENSVTISGTMKNVKTHSGSRGTMVTAWLNQRDISRVSNGDADRIVYVAGINIVGFDGKVVSDLSALDNARQGAEETILVTLKGRLKTKFDTRQIAESEKRAPQIQLEVYEVVTN